MCNCVDYKALEEANEVLLGDMVCYYCHVNKKNLCPICVGKARIKDFEMRMETVFELTRRDALEIYVRADSSYTRSFKEDFPS